MKALRAKSIAIATLLSLSLTTAARASFTGNQDAAPANQPPPSEFLIASPFRKEISPAFNKRRFLTEMLIQEMEMMDLAEQGLKSDDPEIKAMSQKMIETSTQRSQSILNMLDPLNPPFRNAR